MSSKKTGALQGPGQEQGERNMTRQAIISTGTGKGGEYDAAIVTINPAAGRTIDDFPRYGSSPAETGASTSPWRRQLDHFLDLVDQGVLRVGTYYQIGSFRSRAGAGNRLRIMQQDREGRLVPRLEEWEFAFRTVLPQPTSVEGTSQLWAALVAKNEVGEVPEDAAAVELEMCKRFALDHDTFADSFITKMKQTIGSSPYVSYFHRGWIVGSTGQTTFIIDGPVSQVRPLIDQMTAAIADQLGIGTDGAA